MILAVSGLFHIFCSAMHLAQRLMCWMAEARSKTLLVSPLSILLKSPQPGSCWYFPFITAVDNLLWKCNTLNHSCHSLCSSTGKHLEIHSRSINWTTSISPGGKLSLPMSQGKHTHTHMNRRVRESTGKAWGQFLGVLGTAHLGTLDAPLQQPPSTSARLADAWCTFLPFSLEMVVP